MFLLENAQKLEKKAEKKEKEYREKYDDGGTKYNLEKAYYWEEVKDICRFAILSYFKNEDNNSCEGCSNDYWIGNKVCATCRRKYDDHFTR